MTIKDFIIPTVMFFGYAAVTAIVSYLLSRFVDGPYVPGRKMQPSIAPIALLWPILLIAVLIIGPCMVTSHYGRKHAARKP